MYLVHGGVDSGSVSSFVVVCRSSDDHHFTTRSGSKLVFTVVTMTYSSMRMYVQSTTESEGQQESIRVLNDVQNECQFT
jgi:hypothetical protein